MVKQLTINGDMELKKGSKEKAELGQILMQIYALLIK